jgi:hypothetical protein
MAVLSPDFRREQFLHHSTIIDLLSLLKLIKGPNPSLTVHYDSGKSSSTMACKFATQAGTSNQNDDENSLRAEIGTSAVQHILSETYMLEIGIDSIS